MGHPQLATLLKTEKYTAKLFVHENITKKKSNNGICGSISYVTNNKTSILTSIGILVKITLLKITQSITHSNITKTS